MLASVVAVCVSGGALGGCTCLRLLGSIMKARANAGVKGSVHVRAKARVNTSVKASVKVKSEGQ